MINFKWGIISGAAALVFSILLGIVSDVQPFFIFIRALIFTVVFFGLGIGVNILINSFFPELLIKDEPRAADAEEQPGSRVNITLGNVSEYALPEMYKGQGKPPELGNIEDLISGTFRPYAKAASAASAAGASFQTTAFGGIDRKSEDDYNNRGSVQTASKQDGLEFMDLPSSANASSGKPAFTPTFGDDSAGLGGLPDLDSMSTAFSSGGDTPSFKLGGGFSGGSEPDFFTAVTEPAPAQMQSFDEIESLPAKSKSKGDKSQPALQGDFSPQEIAQGIRTVLDKDK